MPFNGGRLSGESLKFGGGKKKLVVRLVLEHVCLKQYYYEQTSKLQCINKNKN